MDGIKIFFIVYYENLKSVYNGMNNECKSFAHNYLSLISGHIQFLSICISVVWISNIFQSPKVLKAWSPLLGEMGHW